MVTGLGLRTLALALFVALAPAAAGGRQAARTSVAPVGEAGAAPWREDLRHLAAELVRVHRNAFHAVPRERFEAEVRELDARIPSLARHQIAAELARIVALVGDGHTVMLSFPFSPELGSRVYPVGLYQFADGVYVHAADPKYAAAVGGKVVSIGGTPVDVAIERMRPCSSRAPRPCTPPGSWPTWSASRSWSRRAGGASRRRSSRRPRRPSTTSSS